MIQLSISQNEEITYGIQKHKQNIWKEHIDAHWDHMHNIHTLWKTIHGLSNRATLHTLNTSKGFNQMAPPARKIAVVLDMSKAFDTINIHTLIRMRYRQKCQAQSLSSSQTISRDAKPTQHIEITHPNNVNLKLAFHKVAPFYPHYLTFTPQTYHHPVYRFRSWPTQTTLQSHPHTQVRVHPRNTYNHTYIQFLPGQNNTTSY